MNVHPDELPFFERLADQLQPRARKDAPLASPVERLGELLFEPLLGAEPRVRLDGEGHVIAIDMFGFSYLSCAFEGTLRIDASRLTRLESLRVFNVTLELDVVHNAALRSLDVGRCSMKTLALPPRLERLKCSATSLDTLDLRACPKLRALDCVSTPIEALDVSMLLELEELSCGWNDNVHYREGASGPRLKTLTLGALPSLRTLDLQNRLYPPTPEGVKVETIDLRGLPKLERLWAGHCALRTLDVSHNPDLRMVFCAHNPLRELDVRGNGKLERLSVEGTDLRAVDVSGLAQLRGLTCGGKLLDAVHLRGTALEHFACENAPRVALDLSEQPLLQSIRLTKCGVESIDVAGSTALREVTIASCPKLRQIKCTEKQKATIAGLRKFFKLSKATTDPAKMDAIALHDFVEHYNWDDGVQKLLKAVRNPGCSLATALTVYWRASPHWYRQFADDAAVPDYQREVVPLMREIERRALEGAYQHHPDIAWVCGDVMRDPNPELEKKRELPAHIVALTRVDSKGR